MISFLSKTIKKTYVAIFIEKSSAFTKITLLFYDVLWFYYGDVGGKKSKNTKNK